MGASEWLSTRLPVAPDWGKLLVMILGWLSRGYVLVATYLLFITIPRNLYFSLIFGGTQVISFANLVWLVQYFLAAVALSWRVAVAILLVQLLRRGLSWTVENYTPPYEFISVDEASLPVRLQDISASRDRQRRVVGGAAFVAVAYQGLVGYVYTTEVQWWVAVHDISTKWFPADVVSLFVTLVTSVPGAFLQSYFALNSQTEFSIFSNLILLWFPSALLVFAWLNLFPYAAGVMHRGWYMLIRDRTR
jgi:hypothetical protein